MLLKFLNRYPFLNMKTVQGLIITFVVPMKVREEQFNIRRKEHEVS
jgi:hypothetical protein